MIIFLFILTAVLLNTAAQVLLKAGMNQIGTFSLTFHHIIKSGLQVAVNPFILGGLFIYVFSVLVWLLVLSRTDVSYAYPMTSLGYILSAAVAYWWLGEQLTLARIVGICVIIAGVYLISRS